LKYFYFIKESIISTIDKLVQVRSS